MDFEKTAEGTGMTVRLIGEVDSLNADKLEHQLLEEVVGVTDLTFDLKDLEYISSSGLRLLLKMQTMMKNQGNMVIINTNDDIMEIFKITGFVRWLHLV